MAITTVAELPLVDMLKWKRAGLIPYKKTVKGLQLVMGIDYNTGDISNFAGSICAMDKTIIRAAKREFLEESLGVFGKIEDHQLENAVAIYGDDELIIFCRIDYDEAYVNRTFNQRRDASSYSEMNNLVFCTVGQFIDYLAGSSGNPPFYTRVRDLIVEAMFTDGFFLE